jgi:pyruvate dehydrogenase E2 component (dihydrolipoamide acetyltransferase)
VEKEFRLPDIGEGLTEAEIIRWLVPVGGSVDSDQPIVEVETDKAVVEIPSPYAGVVVSHGAAEGTTLEVGAVLVVIGDEQVDAPESQIVETPIETSEPEEVVDVEPAESAPIVGTLDEDAEILVQTSDDEPKPTTAGIKALPLVRKLARAKGVDLGSVVGSGPEGRITREDVLAATESEQTQQTPSPPTTEVSPVDESTGAPVTEAEDEPQRMSRLRRTIAANMEQSWAEIPHVTTFDDVDATRLLEVRGALSDRHGMKMPIEALAIKAVVPVLKAYPAFNATLDGENLITHQAMNIGIAVDTDDGLLVAVVHDAASQSMSELATEVARLGQGARERSLAPGDLGAQTFTISNIGAVGGGHGTPLVPYGTTAILSIGRARDQAVVNDGELAVAPVMPLSLSYDHRVIDGGLGRRFMAMLLENLEEPALFLAD